MYYIYICDKQIDNQKGLYMLNKKKNKFAQSREALAEKKAETNRSFFDPHAHYVYEEIIHKNDGSRLKMPFYEKVSLATYGTFIILSAAMINFIDSTYFYNDNGEYKTILFQQYWTEKQFNIVSHSFSIFVLALLFGAGANIVTKKLIAKTLSNKELNTKLNDTLVKLGPSLGNIMKSLATEYPDLAKKLTEGDSLTDVESEIVVDSMRKYLKSHPNTSLLFLDALLVGGFPTEIVDRFVMNFVPGTITYNTAQKVLRQNIR